MTRRGLRLLTMGERLGWLKQQTTTMAAVFALPALLNLPALCR